MRISGKQFWSMNPEQLKIFNAQVKASNARKAKRLQQQHDDGVTIIKLAVTVGILAIVVIVLLAIV